LRAAGSIRTTVECGRQTRIRLTLASEADFAKRAGLRGVAFDLLLHRIGEGIRKLDAEGAAILTQTVSSRCVVWEIPAAVGAIGDPRDFSTVVARKRKDQRCQEPE